MKNLISKFFSYAMGLAAIALLIIPAKVLGVGLVTAGMFNFGSVTFNDEEVRDLSEVIMDEAFKQPKVTQFHTIVQGLIASKQIVYSGLLSKLTKANEGCGTGATSKEIEFRQKFWDPKKVKVWLELCADELDQTLMIYAKQKGINVDDIDGTQIQSFIVDHIIPAMLEDVFRIAWFNDENHTNASDSGGTNEITDAVSVTDYNILNGFWNQLYAIVTADATKRVTIAANAQITSALQDSVFQGNASVASDTFRQMITGADPRLQAAQDKVIICTMSMFWKYAAELEAATGVPQAYTRIEGGFMTLSRMGTPIIGWEFWDRTIRADFFDGSAYIKPHRAVLTTPKNLMIGLDDSGAMSDLELWYEKKDEKNNFRSKYKIDAKVAVDFMTMSAY